MRRTFLYNALLTTDLAKIAELDVDVCSGPFKKIPKSKDNGIRTKTVRRLALLLQIIPVSYKIAMDAA